MDRGLPLNASREGTEEASKAVVYQPKEQVTIVGVYPLDFEVQDRITGKRWLVDKEYFKRKYEAVGIVEDYQ